MIEDPTRQLSALARPAMQSLTEKIPSFPQLSLCLVESTLFSTLSALVSDQSRVCRGFCRLVPVAVTRRV